MLASACDNACRNACVQGEALPGCQGFALAPGQDGGCSLKRNWNCEPNANASPTGPAPANANHTQQTFFGLKPALGSLVAGAGTSAGFRTGAASFTRRTPESYQDSTATMCTDRTRGRRAALGLRWIADAHDNTAVTATSRAAIADRTKLLMMTEHQLPSW